MPDDQPNQQPLRTDLPVARVYCDSNGVVKRLGPNDELIGIYYAGNSRATDAELLSRVKEVKGRAELLTEIADYFNALADAGQFTHPTPPEEAQDIIDLRIATWDLLDVAIAEFREDPPQPYSLNNFPTEMLYIFDRQDLFLGSRDDCDTDLPADIGEILAQLNPEAVLYLILNNPTVLDKWAVSSMEITAQDLNPRHKNSPLFHAAAALKTNGTESAMINHDQVMNNYMHHLLATARSRRMSDDYTGK